MVYLLQDSVLPLCNATQLAQIEDHTSEAGREIAADLSLHWKRWMQQEYGLPEEDSELPLLPEDVAPGQPLVDWRVVYEAKSQEYERRKQVSAQRMRQLWAAEAAQKGSRCMQVIDPPPQRRGHGSTHAGRSRQWGAGASPVPSRQRLLKKLGMARGTGAGTKRPLINARKVVVRRVPGTAAPLQQGQPRLTGPAAAQRAVTPQPGLQLQPCDLDDAWPGAAAEPASRSTPVAQSRIDQRRAGPGPQITDNRYDHRPAFPAPQRQPPACAARSQQPRALQPPCSAVQAARSGLQPASSPQPASKQPPEQRQARSRERAGQAAAPVAAHKRAALETEPAPQPTAKRRKAYDIMGAQQLLAIAGRGRPAPASAGGRSAAQGCAESRAACEERHTASCTTAAAGPIKSSSATHIRGGRLARSSGSTKTHRKEAAGGRSGMPTDVGSVLVEADIFA